MDHTTTVLFGRDKVRICLCLDLKIRAGAIAAPLDGDKCLIEVCERFERALLGGAGMRAIGAATFRGYVDLERERDGVIQKSPLTLNGGV